MVVFILIVCSMGGLIGFATARRSEEIRATAIIVAPFVAWLVLLVLGAIESLMTGVIARGIGGVLMISIGYWLFIAWAVSVACFLAQYASRRAADKPGD